MGLSRGTPDEPTPDHRRTPYFAIRDRRGADDADGPGRPATGPQRDRDFRLAPRGETRSEGHLGNCEDNSFQATKCD